MKRPSSVLCVLVLLGGIFLTSCGGGGGNVPGVIGGVITATFTPGNPTPGANSISMQAGMATDDTFQVVVTVTDIVDFFGTAFRVAFDPATAQYLSFDDSMSFLYNHPSSPVVQFNVSVDPADAGKVLVVATLQNTFLYTPGFTPPANDQVLLVLTFRATDPTAGNDFTFDTAMTREVTTCPQPMGGSPPCVVEPDANLTWSGGTMIAQ